MKCERCETDAATLVERDDAMVCATCVRVIEGATNSERMLVRIYRQLSGVLDINITGVDSDVTVPTYEPRRR